MKSPGTIFWGDLTILDHQKVFLNDFGDVPKKSIFDHFYCVFLVKKDLQNHKGADKFTEWHSVDSQGIHFGQNLTFLGHPRHFSEMYKKSQFLTIFHKGKKDHAPKDGGKNKATAEKLIAETINLFLVFSKLWHQEQPIDSLQVKKVE